MTQLLWDCRKCGAPAAIDRDYQSHVVPPTTPGGDYIHRVRHIDGVWCETRQKEAP